MIIPDGVQASDTLWDDNVVTGDVLVKEFDIHYQIDVPGGSRTEFVK